jgi:hypothetical protein
VSVMRHYINKYLINDRKTILENVEKKANYVEKNSCPVKKMD